jgi:hypothetical protein
MIFVIEKIKLHFLHFHALICHAIITATIYYESTNHK